MTKLRTIEGAGPKMEFPACDAVTLQPPAAKNDNWLPETEHEPEAVNRTGRLELAVAARVNGPGKLWLEIGAKVITCPVFIETTRSRVPAA
jgi:hypothetical protein